MMIIPKEGGKIQDDRIPDDKAELYRRFCNVFPHLPPDKVETIVNYMEEMYCPKDEES